MSHVPGTQANAVTCNAISKPIPGLAARRAVTSMVIQEEAVMKTFSIALLGALAFVCSSAGAQNTPPTDPQIAAIVVTANQVDIDAGKLAKSQSRNKDVKAFA